MTQQSFMGLAIVVLSMIGLLFTPKFLLASHMGRKLKARVGDARALGIARIILVSSLLFGACLAMGLINPRR